MEKIYVILIKKDLKKFKDVPDWFKDNVYDELIRQGLEPLAIVDGKPYVKQEDPIDENSES